MASSFNQGFVKVQDFFNNGITKLQNAFDSANYLESAVHLGYQGVPIAAFGMVVIFLGVMTYATVADKEYGVGAAIESVGDSISSIQLPTVFSPSPDANDRSEIQREEQESAARIKALEEEEKMNKVRGGNKGGKKLGSMKRRISKKRISKKR
jgi:hypothetical protein